ncbi:urease subunit gamma [Thermobispora bispora]|uniref:urease n=1 Tax=Thermobispora bispora (strain ATCC 19993 / DSM 43833 / CBS 139.67 / JCM 10125 / KCTC 9307 / NBRC 14880 / R51) TaxID=469371 RepID=D6Y5B8_THEBD|nr:urease subunit gamma [Thermobispora bispora]MBO2473608.1 urease subunit beta [Actinomycetales bacterium]MDI9581897.1 urease subunit gamma [Thermobispora sp.]ADG89313.1 urease, gamma subunit [Thermobispora bispora DSM 43833]MBX6167990.1 urease subunit gamma [Thermobispora bispora]QSI48980.1 urease subunit gamma [Thermobispora bispora]
MHLTPREQERLTIFTLAELARRRRARGRRLNAPEAIALICDEILELAWDGASLEEVVAAARSVLTADDVMEGVPALVPHVQVEALFPNGTALVAVDQPIGPPAGDDPGAIRTADGEIPINTGRRRIRIAVRNEGDRTVYVSSHFPLSEVNAALVFDREAAAGMRLDIPAGTALAFPPGEERLVDLVATAPQQSAPQESTP